MLQELLLFVLAVLPLIVVLVGILMFSQSGARMAIIGLVVTILIAVLVFKTDLKVALAASWYGILKSLGITVAVIFTMLMIFIMRETGALKDISGLLNAVSGSKEEQALFVGIAFGSFVTSLGIVTPAMFPPLLLAMGFNPFSAVAIAVLGYNATTSYALLSIPLTIPAEAFGLDAFLLSLKVSMFLPVISIGLSFALLWIIGGKESMKKGWLPALIVGMTMALVCLFISWSQILAIQLIGVVAGIAGMLSLLIYGKVKGWSVQSIDWPRVLKAASPWIILIALVAIVYLPFSQNALKPLLGDTEVIMIWDQAVDLNILTQIYTWIAIATALAIPILKPSGQQMKNAFKTWSKSIWAPAISYSLYFAIAYVMAWSAKEVISGSLVASAHYDIYNMNNAVGYVLSSVFGKSYIFMAVWLGLFGAVVGGSEAGSNMLFYGIQNKAATDIGLSHNDFMTLYAGHAVAGGVASAITPSKINNAVATINEGPELESKIMKKHIVIVLMLTAVTGILNGLFIYLL